MLSIRYRSKRVAPALVALALLGFCPKLASADTFTPVIDTFEIWKNSNQIFLDTFSSNVVPAEGPDGANTYAVTGAAGMTSESGGKLTMTPSLGDPAGNISSADTITRALRLSTLDSNNANFLGVGDSVQVKGLFDISLLNTLPTFAGQSFGIRLQDGTATAAATDIAQLNVIINSSGVLGVRFAELDTVAVTNKTAGFVSIASQLTNAAFIELIISKAAGSANPTASFNIYDAAMALLYSSAVDNNLDDGSGLITLFQGETFTRAAFFSTDAVPLPGALPLFATVLAGGGVMAWRRRRKSVARQAA